MTTGDKLLQDISDMKDEVMTLALEYINLSKNGEDLGCKEDKLTILLGKIRAMITFYTLNFDANGNITPLYTCPQTTLIRKYINPNFQPPIPGIEINIIDGGGA